MRKSLKKTLIEDLGYSHDEATTAIEDARRDLQDLIEEGDFTAAFEVMQDHFSLEPDYLEELLLELF